MNTILRIIDAAHRAAEFTACLLLVTVTLGCSDALVDYYRVHGTE